MSRSRADGRGRDFRASIGITILLGSSAALVVGYWSWRALSRADTEPLESPLTLSVARQLVDGPGGLYGPFGGGNPLVLIHAPLYYRLAALTAWPMVRAGIGPVTAAMVAGRLLSVFGLLATVGMAYRLARLDGAPRKAGWWAALLILAGPILSGFPFAVRPDMIGIALQTAGVLLVLSALQANRPGAAKLLLAYAAFGLSVCVKQHNVGAAAISTGLLLAAWMRGRLALGRIISSLLVAASLVLVVYGVEEFATHGRMSQAVLVAAASVGRVHPGDWGHVRIVAIAAMGRTIGLLALLSAARLAAVAARPGLTRRAFAIAGGMLVGLLVGLLPLHLVLIAGGSIAVLDPRLVDLILYAGAISFLLGFVMALLIIPACMAIERWSYPGARLDTALVAFVVAEVVIMAALCRISTGAWANYAIEAYVLASVLTGRALARACDEAPSRRLVVAAASAVLFGAIMHIHEVESVRFVDRLELAELFDRVKRPRSEFFFVDRPEQNRADGRLELVYDDWLYPVFESIGLAEARSLWLDRLLTSGSIQVVVTTSDGPRIAGIKEPLTRLRYYAAMRVGPYFVWVRQSSGAK
jgi:hypothetical protein